MKYIKLFEYFDRDAFDKRTQIHKDEAVLFQDIINLIKVALGKNSSDIEDVTKSTTEFGHSWYIKFDNGAEIRISDHSPVSTHRIMDSKYIDFINVYDDFTLADAKRVADLYQSDKVVRRKDRRAMGTVATNTNRAHSHIVSDINNFLDDLKKNNKTIYKSTDTRDSLYMFKRRNPTAEHIMQIETGDTYGYTWVDTEGKGRSYPVSKEYYEYLKKNNII